MVPSSSSDHKSPIGGVQTGQLSRHPLKPLHSENGSRLLRFCVSAGAGVRCTAWFSRNHQLLYVRRQSRCQRKMLVKPEEVFQ